MRVGMAFGTAMVLAAATAMLLQPSASGQSRSRIIDRTLLCSTGVQGGTRVIDVSAKTAFGKGGRLEWLGQIVVTTPGKPIPGKPNSRPTVAGITAGWPPPAALQSGGGLGFANKECRPASARVGFSRRGLLGFPASELGDEYTCRVQRTLLVRVRAEFRSPAALEISTDRTYRSAIGRVESGQIAVRSLAGKPIVFADVSDSGRARIFTGANCN